MRPVLLSILLFSYLSLYLVAQETKATAPEPPKRVRIASEVARDLLIESPAPVYPDAAKDAGIRGVVVLKLLIDTEGRVKDAEVVSGHELLVQAHLDAVRQWRYKPYRINGQPVEVETRVFAGVGRPQCTSGVTEGKVRKQVKPKYPEEARRQRIQGAVLLHAVIGEDGRVINLKVVSGPPELTDAAIKAVSQWQYKPYLLCDEPVKVETHITVNFALN